MSKRILIADDSASIRQLVEMTLRSKGHTVVATTDGAAALRQFQATPDFALVITDFNMPGATGLDVVKGIRAHPAGARIPILVLSTMLSSSDQRALQDARATAYLNKPFDPFKLLQVLTALRV